MSEGGPQTARWRGGLAAPVRAEAASHAAAVLKVVGAIVLTALAAQVRVPVPGSPVPVTLQTLAVLLIGFALGGRLASVAMLAYVALGAAGLPVFAVGLLGPTGGYLVGFVFAAALVGRYGQSGCGSWLRTTVVAAVGTAFILACGVIWLATWLGGDLTVAVATGLVPFVPGAVLKTAVAVAAVRAWRELGVRL